jgi:hypothetical protein
MDAATYNVLALLLLLFPPSLPFPSHNKGDGDLRRARRNPDPDQTIQTLEDLELLRHHTHKSNC